MPITTQKYIALGLFALHVTMAEALTIGPTLVPPAAADDSDALGDCLGLVQVGWPRRELAAAKTASEAEAEVAMPAEWEDTTQHQQPMVDSTFATIVPAEAHAEVLASASFEKAPAAVGASAEDGFLVAGADRLPQAKQLAALSMVVGLLAVALRFRLSGFRTQCQPDKASKPLAVDPSLEGMPEAEGKQEEPDPGHPTEMLEMPPPMRRLRYIGASYVVPRERIERCSSETLSFDVPTLPCVWPLRAQLFRPEPAAAWARLQLTVDIIAASGLPPLLTCTRPEAMARPDETGGTGGTGSPSHEAAAMPSLGGWDELRLGEGVEEGEDPEAEASPWLKICNAGGSVVATIRRRRDGSCLVQLQDRTSWDLSVHLEGVAPGITFSKQGQEICQATSLGSGREEHIQVDTQPDVQSPESCVLLLCTIAVLAFQP